MQADVELSRAMYERRLEAFVSISIFFGQNHQLKFGLVLRCGIKWTVLLVYVPEWLSSEFPHQYAFVFVYETRVDELLPSRPFVALL